MYEREAATTHLQSRQANPHDSGIFPQTPERKFLRAVDQNHFRLSFQDNPGLPAIGLYSGRGSISCQPGGGRGKRILRRASAAQDNLNGLGRVKVRSNLEDRASRLMAGRKASIRLDQSSPMLEYLSSTKRCVRSASILFFRHDNNFFSAASGWPRRPLRSGLS